MAYPIKVCSICSEEFELRPDKPGFANRCPACSAEDSEAGGAKGKGTEPRSDSALNEERRRVMRDLLYRKDS